MSEMLNEILEDEQEDVIVLDDASAEMLMQQIAGADAEYERMEAWYKQQMTRIRERRDRIVSWAEGCLRGYFDMVPKHETKTTKSYQLPGGKLVMKQLGPDFSRDPEALLSWAKKYAPECVKVEESVSWVDLKKKLKVVGANMVTEDGEIVPGITVTEKEPEFHAVPNK